MDEWPGCVCVLYLDGVSEHSNHMDLISGDGTPAYFYFQALGKSLVPLWIKCASPQAKLIILFRDPVACVDN